MRPPRPRSTWPWLLAPVLLAFGLPLAAGRVYVQQDNGVFFQPHKALIAQALREGRLPQWNPYEYGGLPLLADANFTFFHPLSLLTHLVPAPQGQMLFLAACLLLAGIGAYLLARALGVREAGALLAGGAYAWGGTLLSLVMCGHAAAACTLPWLAWAGARAGSAPGPRAALALALAAASALLGDMPEVGAQGLLLAALLLVSEAWRTAGREKAARALGWGALAVVLGAALAAVQLLPTAAYVGASSRAAGFGAGDAQAHSLLPLRLLSLAVPFLLGSSDAPGAPSWLSPLPEAPYIPEIHLGAVVLLCAVAGLAGRGARRRWPLVLAGLLLLVLALGSHTPVYGLLWRLLPPLRFIRYPEKLVVTLALALAVCAGAGWERLTARAEPGAASSLAGRLLWPALLIALLAALAAALFPLWGAGFLAGLGSAREACFRATALVSLPAEAALLSLALLCLLLRRAGRLSPRFAALALFCVFALDLGWPASRMEPTALAEEVTTPSPLIEELSRAAGQPRWAFRTSPERLGIPEEALDPAIPRTRAVFLIRHAGLIDAAPALDGFFLDRGYSGFTPGGLNAVFNAADGGAVLDMLGVRFGVEVGLGRPRFERLGFTPRPGLSNKGALVRVFEKPAAREKLRLVPTVLAGPKAGGLLPRCAGSEAAWLDPGGTALLPPSLVALPACPPGPVPEGGAARITRYLPEQVEAEVDAQAPSLAVLNDTAAPGWTATVDGAPTPALAADGAFRAVAVEKGRHQLVWRYQTPGLRAGAAVSAAALLALGALGLLSWRQRTGARQR